MPEGSTRPAGERTRPRPVWFLELNEVTNAVLDRQIARRPTGTLARLCATGRRLRTSLPHEGLLEPWTAWPGIHRGVQDGTHGIFAIGQDTAALDLTLPPIWRRLARAGFGVGVFAPFQAPHPEPGAEPYAFFVPTYFAEDDRTTPDWLTPFHAFNRAMTQGSKHNVATFLPLGVAARFLRAAPGLGITASTIAALARQLAAERVNRLRRGRRRALQSLLATDVFLEACRVTRPDFALLSGTNVAANLHRYWAATWPGDYRTLPLSPEYRARYAQEVWHALDVFETVLERLARACEAEAAILVVASGFGQAAGSPTHNFSFLTLLDPAAFLRVLGLDAAPREAPGMVPFVNLRLPPEAIEMALSVLPRVSIGEHRFVESRGEDPLAFTRVANDMIVLRVQLQDHVGPDHLTIDGRGEIALAAAGFGSMEHEDGVEYAARHVTEGSGLVWDPLQPGDGRMTECSALDLVPSLMRHFGLPDDPLLPGRAFPLDVAAPAARLSAEAMS